MQVRWAFAGAAVAALCLSAGSCEEPPVLPHNHPPTIVITAGPSGVVTSDTVRFEWLGQDPDGNLCGYCYGIDDSTPATWTESTGVALTGLAYGEHDFYVEAVDDSGARSLAAARSFISQFATVVQPRGTDTTLELATWNIENMPRSPNTVRALQALIPALGLDIYAVQEIADTLAFRQVLAGLSGYDGLFSADDYGSFYQKTGVIYRRGVVAVSDVRQLFWRSSAFPRPPLEMNVRAEHHGQSFDFRLIVLHLKAGTAPEDEEQRRQSCIELKAYLDSVLVAGGDSDVVVVGDWNDRLDDPSPDNVFAPLLDDTLDYRFLTLPLAGSSQNASYIGGSLIDHVMVTTAALAEYGSGYTTTLRLDDEMASYEVDVSDHRPVMSVFPVFPP
jgi:exonuclease III